MENGENLVKECLLMERLRRTKLHLDSKNCKRSLGSEIVKHHSVPS